MNGEFHIFASATESRFTLKGCGQHPAREFSSLFEAARHARTRSSSLKGFVIIYDESAKGVNRIPFSITPSSAAQPTK